MSGTKIPAEIFTRQSSAKILLAKAFFNSKAYRKVVSLKKKACVYIKMIISSLSMSTGRGKRKPRNDVTKLSISRDKKLISADEKRKKRRLKSSLETEMGFLLIAS